MNKLLLCALALLVSIATFASADSCLQYPPSLRKGKSCSAAFPNCQIGTFCNEHGVCAESVGENQPCNPELDGQCLHPFFCHQEDKKCTAYRNVGEKCDVIECGFGLTCDSENEVCVGGFHGDQGCTNNDHCRGNLTCSGGTCAANDNGLECDSDFECVPGSFCDRDGKCATKKTFGICRGNDCAPGYVCNPPAPSAEMQCIEEHSLKTGEYCGNQDAVCSGANRCYGNYCAKRGVRHCNSEAQCGEGELCTCGGRILADGIGTCSRYACTSRVRRLLKCVEENCNYGGELNILEVNPKSCLHLNCGDELEAWSDCNGASLLSPLLLSLVLPVLALLRL